MRRPVHVLRPDEDHTIAAEVMCERRIKRLPIAHNGKLLGIVSLSDLAAIAGGEAEGLRTALQIFHRHRAHPGVPERRPEKPTSRPAPFRRPGNTPTMTGKFSTPADLDRLTD